MTVRTAMEIAGNYPDNIRIDSQVTKSGEYCGFLYLLRDGSIHKHMVTTTETYETSEEAETVLHEVCEWAISNYGE